MSHYTDIDYDEFFRNTVKSLNMNLPAELMQFEPRRPSNSGWLVIKYSFKYSHYELHLSSHSRNHAKYFGVGPHVTIAFYYATKFGDSEMWMDALAPHIEQIQKRLGKPVVIGPWSENWVWIAACLDDEPRTSDNLSNLFALFIQATYEPITLAFKAIGR